MVEHKYIIQQLIKYMDLTQNTNIFNSPVKQISLISVLYGCGISHSIWIFIFLYMKTNLTFVIIYLLLLVNLPK